MIAGIAGSIPAEDADVRLLCLSCDVRRADHCQNSPAGCVCVCDPETSTMRTSNPALGCCTTGKKIEDER
jgi:hypothetical protein